MNNEISMKRHLNIKYSLNMVTTNYQKRLKRRTWNRTWILLFFRMCYHYTIRPDENIYECKRFLISIHEHWADTMIPTLDSIQNVSEHEMQSQNGRYSCYQNKHKKVHLESNLKHYIGEGQPKSPSTDVNMLPLHHTPRQLCKWVQTFYYNHSWILNRHKVPKLYTMQNVPSREATQTSQDCLPETHTYNKVDRAFFGFAQLQHSWVPLAL